MGPNRGRKVFTLQTQPGVQAAGPFTEIVAQIAGFSLHAGVVAKSHERTKRERLCRYITRPLDERGWRVENLDSTIIAQAPKLAPHIPAMIANIAADLGISADCVNVKATTTEKLGFAGREEGIAAHAVVLLTSIAERPSGYDVIP